MSIDEPKDMDGNVESDGEDLSQDELDALIAEAEQEFAESGGTPEEDTGILTQESLDALLQAQAQANEEKPKSPEIFSPDSIDGASPVIEKEPIEDPAILSKLLGAGSSETPDDSPQGEDDGFVDQKQLDAFIEETVSSGTVAAKAESDDTGTPEDAKVTEDQGLINQDELNELMASAKDASSAQKDEVEEVGPIVDKTIRPADFAVVESDEGTLSQDDIDALMNQSSSPDAEDDTSENTDAPEEAEDEGSLDQSDIDALLATASDTSESSSEPEKTEESEDEGALDQSDIDALMDSASDTSDSPSYAPSSDDAVDDSESMDQSTIDALMESEQASSEVGEDELVETSEELVAQDMDERLDPDSPAQETKISADTETLADTETSEPDNDTAGSEPSAEEAAPVPAEEAVAAVASENVAAGAVESQEVRIDAIPKNDTSPAAPSPPDEEYAAMDSLDEVVGHGDATSTSGGSIFNSLLDSVKEEPYRAITGLAAGMLVAITAMLYMTANRLQDPPDMGTMAIVIGQGDIERQLALAQGYVDEKEYARATELLDAIISNAHSRPLKTDARYLRLEARYHQLPDTVSVGLANTMHAEIDAVINAAPMHPRKPHALFWKASLYEKENNVLAARVEYRELLRNENGADNRDVVLLAIAELELDTERPIQAARYLQRLRREHAGSDLAEKAQLLLGDAYNNAGDDEQARNLYIRIAENNPGNQLGAQAFTKLGALAYDTGNYDRAIRDLETRLQTATSIEGNDKATLMLAKAYRAADRLDDAQNTLKGLLDFFPESDITPLANIEMSRVLDESGQLKEAVRFATQTAQRYPGNPDVLRNAGEILAKAGNSREAARALIAADAAGANDPELLLTAGKLYRQDNAMSNARDVLTRLTMEFPGTEQGFLGSIELARVLYDEGLPTKAARLLADLSRTTSSSAQRLKLLGAQGELYDDMGLSLKVAEVYSEIAFMTEEPDMLAKSALALFKNQQYDDGLSVAQRVDTSKLSANRAYAFLNVQGQAMLQVDPRKGLDLLEQAHAGYPSERTAKYVQALLESNLTLGRSARARASALVVRPVRRLSSSSSWAVTPSARISPPRSGNCITLCPIPSMTAPAEATT
ncbi:MAG: hypothetical protein COA73_12730, partial [Candidatus Hydrogenedentota bacterium]